MACMTSGLVNHVQHYIEQARIWARPPLDMADRVKPKRHDGLVAMASNTPKSIQNTVTRFVRVNPPVVEWFIELYRRLSVVVRPVKDLTEVHGLPDSEMVDQPEQVHTRRYERPTQVVFAKSTNFAKHGLPGVLKFLMQCGFNRITHLRSFVVMLRTTGPR